MLPIRLLFCLLMSAFCTIATAQEDKYDYIWLFGYYPNIPEDNFGGSMLNFHIQPREISYFDLPVDFEFFTVNTISNKAGSLVLYTDGCEILNRDHEVMVNGDTLNPGFVYDSYCPGYPYIQGMITLPRPGSDSLYDLVHISYNAQLYTTNLLHSIVDASGADGLGEVIEKNVLLFQDTFADLLHSVRHGNGRDWWVIVPKVGSNIHYVFLLSPQGIAGPIIRQAGAIWNEDYWSGQAVFSPDGSKYIKVNPFNGIHIFDFDRCSGELYNPVALEFVGDTIYSTTGAGVSVSPNSRYLYVSISPKVYQYDLQAADIGASRQLIGYYDGFLSPFPTNFFQHTLAPDGKIYLNSTSGVNRLHVIHNPDQPGLACNLEQHGIRLPTYHAFAMPNFPHFRLYDLPGSPCDTLGISTADEEPERQEAGIKIFPNPADGVAYIELPPGVVGKLQVWNAEGKVMYDQEIGAHAGQRLLVNTAQWPAGVYFCVFYDNRGRDERRVTFVVTH